MATDRGPSGLGRPGFHVPRLPLVSVVAVFACAACAACAAFAACATTRPEIRTGDLLFLDLDCGATCDAIEGVTEGVRGAHLSHVGVADLAASGEVYVIEAYDGVTRTPLADFLARTAGRYVHARLKPPWQTLGVAAAAAARRHAGAAYDPLFRLGDDRYYCSELVWEAFRDANGGAPLFELAPMDFGDPTGERGPWWSVWAAYFAERGVPVPQGEPGINPGAISRSERLDVLYFDP